MAIVTNEQAGFLGVMGVLGGVALWYASRKLGAVVEQAIDEGVEVAAEVATSPMQATGPEWWGLKDDSTTIGTRGWFAKATDLGEWSGTMGEVGPVSPYNGTLNENAELPGF